MTVMEERFELAAERVKQVSREHETAEPFRSFFAETADYVAVMIEEYRWIAGGGLQRADLQELERHNEICHIDLLGRNYETSWANPAWAVKQLGEKFGQLLCAVSAELHSLTAFVYEQDLEALTIRIELFLEIYCAFVDAAQEKAEPDYEQIREIFYWFASDYAELTAEHAVAGSVDWEKDFAKKIVMESDISDIRYLFYYGEYIADDQWKLAEYLNGLPEEKIQKIADTYTEGYKKGFELAKKNIKCKKSVNIRYPLGFERVVRAAVENFAKMGLEPDISARR